MARTPRLVAPGMPHHIYLRGNNRRRLFSTALDYQWLLYCLAAGLEVSDCMLHQLTIMTNHLHMIVTPARTDSLAMLTKRTNQRYAQVRNRARGGSGKLFEERYHSKVIDSDKQLWATMLYNDANAYRARMVRDPFVHGWSTVPLHCGVPERCRIPEGLWTPGSWYVGLGKDRSEREKRYRVLMCLYLGAGAPCPPDTPDDSEMSAPYRRRLERPDGSSAREQDAPWGER